MRCCCGCFAAGILAYARKNLARAGMAGAVRPFFGGAAQVALEIWAGGRGCFVRWYVEGSCAGRGVAFRLHVRNVARGHGMPSAWRDLAQGRGGDGGCPSSFIEEWSWILASLPGCDHCRIFMDGYGRVSDQGTRR